MTKKLRPTRSLRSLLFGGPHLEIIFPSSMEESIQRLREIEQKQKLGEYPCGQIEFNDLGRVVHWRFEVKAPITHTGQPKEYTLPVKGSFSLEADGRIRLKVRVGSSIRTVVLWGVLGLAGFAVISIVTFLIRTRPQLNLPSWSFSQPLEVLPAIALILLACGIVLMLIVFGPAVEKRLPTLSYDDDIYNIIEHLKTTLVYAPLRPSNQP
ncbi:MAG: hypothetical protein J0M33_21260 [Anaerolineae bacterium]|nr:hypothetical protein [Anaerolineae bacterium]